MRSEDIMAVIVSYNGGETTRETILALVGQVGHIHVVDNGSAPDSTEILESLARESVISVDRLATNRGIGHALNLGAAQAKKTGFTWLLTMDQDSAVASDMIAAYQAALAPGSRVASLSPRIADKRKARASVSVEVKSAITSGNLVLISAFDIVGPYDEGFFIDCIDFDFSLRLRRSGYRLLRVQNAEMQHRLGEPTKLPAWLSGFYARHSPLRRYYMTRNYLYLVERYLLEFPGFIIRLGLLRIILYMLILFFDRNPFRSYRAIARGLRDYIARREGPCPSAS